MLLRGVGNMGGLGLPNVVDSYAGKYSTRHLDGLLAYWSMEEESGSFAEALPSSGYKGTYTGVTLNSTASPIDALGAPSFDGVNDRLRLNTTFFKDNFPFSSGTLSIWYKRTDYTSLRPIYDFRTSATGSSFWLRQSSAGLISLRLSEATSFVTMNIATDVTTIWHNVTVSWDINTDIVTGYFDGTNQNSTSFPDFDDATSFYSSADFGNRAGITGPWSGFLSHAALWNKVLDTSAVANIASTRLTSGGP